MHMQNRDIVRALKKYSYYCCFIKLMHLWFLLDVVGLFGYKGQLTPTEWGLCLELFFFKNKDKGD